MLNQDCVGFYKASAFEDLGWLLRDWISSLSVLAWILTFDCIFGLIIHAYMLHWKRNRSNSLSPIFHAKQSDHSRILCIRVLISLQTSKYWQLFTVCKVKINSLPKLQKTTSQMHILAELMKYHIIWFCISWLKI